jgi:hypothetical protein
MNHGKLVFRPTLLHRGCLDDVPALFMHIQLDQAIVLRVALQLIQLILVQAVHVSDIPEPGVQQPHVFGRHGGFDAAAAVMAAHYDVLYFEVTDSVVYDGHDVEVDVVDEVGDVAVDEHFAGFEACYGFGGDAGVGAACEYDPLAIASHIYNVDVEIGMRRSGVGWLLIWFLVEWIWKLTNPKILRTLARAQIRKEARIFLLHLGCPFLVVVEDAIMALLKVLAHLLDLLGILGRHSEIFFPRQMEGSDVSLQACRKSRRRNRGDLSC